MTAPRRVISLVPSLTETIVSFGLLDRLVGRTRYCVEPRGIIDRVETVGGTKNPNVTRIIALAPDIVVVNKEENRIEDCRVLEAAGLRLHVTQPRSVEQAAGMLESLGAVLDAEPAGRRLATACRKAVGHARGLLSGNMRLRVFCPVWRRPWMTFRNGTYAGDFLATVGLDNVFAGDDRGDFFEISISEAIERGPDIVLLADEPYPFALAHAKEMEEAGLRARLFFVSGKDLYWYGPRLPASLSRFATQVRQWAG